VSDAISDDYSLQSPRGKYPTARAATGKYSKKQADNNQNYDNNYHSLASNFFSSYVIHEKKQPGKFEKNDIYNNLGGGMAAASRANMNTNVLANSDDTLAEEEPLPIAGQNSGREENYQRLSASINDLFANLLKELEKQKNKEYLMNNVDELLNKAKLTNFLMMSSGKIQQQPGLVVGGSNKKAPLEEEEEVEINEEVEKTNLNNLSIHHHHYRKSKTNNNSNDSNKDSGFNQESFYNNMGSPESSNKNNNSKSNAQSMRHTNLKSSNSLNGQDENAKQPVGQADITQNNSPKSSSLSNNDHQEMSLLERYLNSEQIIAYKHTQIEVLLHKWFVKQNSFLIDDDYYSIIEYILNQEGISLKTFMKLIKEKFNSIEWHDELLVDLYDIVNYDEKRGQAVASSGSEAEKTARNKAIESKLDYQDSMPDTEHFYKVSTINQLKKNINLTARYLFLFNYSL
jgi:hypothetical protein